MKVLYDLTATQPFGGDFFSGGGEYAKAVFFKLCQLLDKLKKENTQLEVFYSKKRKIDNDILELCSGNNIPAHICNSNNEISNLLCQNKYDIFYSALPYTYYNLIIPDETHFKFTIHGLRSLETLPEKYWLKYQKGSLKRIIRHFVSLYFSSNLKHFISKNNINNLNKLFFVAKNYSIITVSYHSKYSILYFFPKLNDSDIKVLYSPNKNFNIEENKDTNILNLLSLGQKKYILLIMGSRSGKGAYRACKVLYHLITKHSGIPKDIQVLILGIKNKKQYLKLTKNNSRFIFYDYVSSEDLETLYKNSHLFLFPTLNEGFGYPPIEAIKYGTLCACSANSSVTEVCADSVIYFNPFDEVEMGNRILQSFDPDVIKNKTDKMRMQYDYIRSKQEQDLELLVKEIIHAAN